MQIQNSIYDRPTTYKAWANGNISIPHGYRRPKQSHEPNPTDQKEIHSRILNLGTKRNIKTKNFKVTKQNRKVFMSRAIVAQLRSKRKMTTMLLTYPLDKKVDDPYKDLNRFLTNLRKNYKLEYYLSALEKTKNGQWHFHLLLDMPWYRPADVKKAWNSAAGIESNNSVRDMRKIKHAKGCISYCAKYLYKDESKDHDKRKFSYSKNLVGTENVEIDENDLYTSRITVTDSVRFEYCSILRVELNKDYLSYFMQENLQNTIVMPLKPPESTCIDVKNTYKQGVFTYKYV